MNIRPLGDRLRVKKIKPESKTESGIILSEVPTTSTTITGIVEAIGHKIISPELKVGVIILFSKYSGMETGEEQVIIREEEVLGVIDNG